MTTTSELNTRLWEGGELVRAEAADMLATTKTRPLHQEWTVTVYDKFWRPLREVGDALIELTGTDPRNKLPSATLIIKATAEYADLVEIFMGCEQTMVGVTVETGGLRFPFYVDTFDYDYTNGAWTGTANLLGIWDILNYLQIWPNFLAPIQAQVPSHAVFAWALCTVIETMVSECSWRIQTGLNEFINNAASLNPDFRAWIGTLLQSRGNIAQMLKTPLYVVRTNPLLDSSPLVVKTVRMESCGSIITELTRAYGVDVRVDLWLPGDEQPDKWTKTIPGWALDQPTYLLIVKDRSQTEGPTKTMADSAIRTVVDIGGSFFNGLPPIITRVPGMSGVYESPLLGVNYTPPWAVLIAPDSGEDGSVVSCRVSFHTQKGWQHLLGGRSPKWLNDLMNATFAWLIDSLSILIGVTGIPSNLLDGFLNNSFLAFQLIQHYGRRNDAGPYHPAIEVFHATASAPYNVEAGFAFINALWDSRPWVSAQVTIRNGEIYTLGKDIFRGGLISLVYFHRTKLLTDYIENIMFRLTASERDVMIQIGDGQAEESPLARYQRLLTGALETINVATLAPQS